MASSTTNVNYDEIKFSEKVLGCGAFGLVKQAKWDNREIAVKQLFPRNNENRQGEITQLSRVQHKNIIKLYGISKRDGMTYLLLEYMEGGSLEKFLYGPRKNEHRYWYAIDWAYQIAQALAYLHGHYEKPIIHRDIKPDNILLSGQYLTVKIGDFGNATCQKLKMTCENGTPIYMAPEVNKSNNYTEKCDVYSFAITLWEMLAMQTPLAYFTSREELFRNVNAGDRPSFGGEMVNCPQTMKELIISCWAGSPTDRPSMESVVRDLGDLVLKV